MLETSLYKPISGTFVSCLNGDTGINNWGIKEWEYEFKLYKAIGIDTVIIIRSEMEVGGVPVSGLDPRSTTWKEDPNLISMFFRLAEKYDLKIYLGGTVSLDNLYKGYWKREIDDNARFYEIMLEKFCDYKCFHGIYCSIEALPWHFNFCDIAIGIAKVAQKLAPDKKKLFSPSLFGLTGYMNSQYSLDDFENIYGEMLNQMSGCMDYCAWQDTYYLPDCKLGEIRSSRLDEWYNSANKITKTAGIE